MKRLFINVPTRVGVNPTHHPDDPGRNKCPHACGGEPSVGRQVRPVARMSPRVWG